MSEDTAGKVTIPAGAKKVRVKFKQAFTTAPLVTLTAPQSVVVKYELGEVTTSESNIVLSEELKQPMTLQWLAIETAAGQATEAEVVEGSTASPSVAVSPIAQTPASTLSPTPLLLTSPSLSPVPSIDPCPSVTPSASPEVTPSPQIAAP